LRQSLANKNLRKLLSYKVTDNSFWDDDTEKHRPSANIFYKMSSIHKNLQKTAFTKIIVKAALFS